MYQTLPPSCEGAGTQTNTKDIKMYTDTQEKALSYYHTDPSEMCHTFNINSEIHYLALVQQSF